tara:strand:- start:766 stop:1278 length:513 start_codon:yes stop_codon:yes gene_type:complete
MQLISITSEALQATIRRLLPSQSGFSEDLQAQNVITPIIDLTPTAEGTQLRADLQTANSRNTVDTSLSAGVQVTVGATPGFWLVFGYLSSTSTGVATVRLRLDDGTTNYDIFRYALAAGDTQNISPQVCYAPAGHTLACLPGALTSGRLYTRQIADINGELINPFGYTPQ